MGGERRRNHKSCQKVRNDQELTLVYGKEEGREREEGRKEEEGEREDEGSE